VVAFLALPAGETALVLDDGLLNFGLKLDNILHNGMFFHMRQWSADRKIGAASIGFQLFPRQDAS